MKTLVSVLKRSITRTFYVHITRNRIRHRHLESGMEVSLEAEQPFTGPRLLVAEFSVAQRMLQRGIRMLTSGVGLAPVIVVSAGEMVEGGLSESEERLLLELGYQAGARFVAVVTGDLSDVEVREVIRGRGLLRA